MQLASPAEREKLIPEFYEAALKLARALLSQINATRSLNPFDAAAIAHDAVTRVVIDVADGKVIYDWEAYLHKVVFRRFMRHKKQQRREILVPVFDESEGDMEDSQSVFYTGDFRNHNPLSQTVLIEVREIVNQGIAIIEDVLRFPGFTGYRGPLVRRTVLLALQDKTGWLTLLPGYMRIRAEALVSVIRYRLRKLLTEANLGRLRSLPRE